MWMLKKIISLNKLLAFESGVNHPIQIRASNPVFKSFLFVSELCGKLFFNKFTRNFYCYEVNERIVENAFILRNLHMAPGATILDFGCNRSHLPIELASIGYKVTGIDLLPYGYRHSNFSFIQDDLLNIRFPENHFSAVVSVSAIEHTGLGFYGGPVSINADLEVMAEIFRILKPGGAAIITVPFGISSRNDFTRVYDTERLSALINPFHKIREEYYSQDMNKQQWLPVKKDLLNLEIKDGKFNYVACLILLKD
jgi:SAM-dependent methyltransferase